MARSEPCFSGRHDGTDTQDCAPDIFIRRLRDTTIKNLLALIYTYAGLPIPFSNCLLCVYPILT